MRTVFLTGKRYSERYETVLTEKEQSFDILRSYKVKKGKNAVMDIGL